MWLTDFWRSDVHRSAPERTEPQLSAPVCTDPLPAPPQCAQSIPVWQRKQKPRVTKPVTQEDLWVTESAVLQYIHETAPYTEKGTQRYITLSQRQMAKKFGIHHTTYGRWLKRWEQECLVALKRKGNRILVRGTAMTGDTKWCR